MNNSLAKEILATAEQMKTLDLVTQTQYGVSAESLMESAGALASKEILQTLIEKKLHGPISIFCGPGNNGGDGLVVARHLYGAGLQNINIFYLNLDWDGVSLQTLFDLKKISPLLKLQWERIHHLGLKVHLPKKNTDFFTKINQSSLLIDAIFGIGFKSRDPNQRQNIWINEVIHAINSSQKPIISLDLPSGLDVTCGLAHAPTIRAQQTLSFGLGKPGFYIKDGPEHVGELKILPIGFPFNEVIKIASSHTLFTENLAKNYLPPRANNSHKSNHGHLLVVAGHEDMWGAGVLACSSAYRMGAGYVTWSSFHSPQLQIETLPEVLTQPWKGIETWASTRQKEVDAIVVGPGLGICKETVEILRCIKNHYSRPVIVDADALSVAAKYNLFPFPAHWVVTPHMGELARITKKPVEELEKDRFQAALYASKITGCIVLLKGFRTLVAHGNKFLIIPSGNASLAKAGTGDILSGMIGCLLAQGVPPLFAAATGAYIHGRVADEWLLEQNDSRSLCAHDIADRLPQLLNKITQSS
ncbi:MAG: NAD(P)H-hydrate dehydratase [Bdellovibrionales bacterium]|nr:NAD(P)H-hydrate dehydratase [Bdellovibrionales bacterium]